jgi:hypothetical protein
MRVGPNTMAKARTERDIKGEAIAMGKMVAIIKDASYVVEQAAG